MMAHPGNIPILFQTETPVYSAKSFKPKIAAQSLGLNDKLRLGSKKISIYKSLIEYAPERAHRNWLICSR